VNALPGPTFAKRRFSFNVSPTSEHTAPDPTQRARLSMATPAFTLPSPETATSYSIFIAKPSRAARDQPWRVMCFLDGDDQFTDAKKAFAALQKTNAVPPLLLVGIGYGASYSKPTNHRVRDYTPTTAHDEAQSGHAAAFYAFLTKTLWPELERRYPITNEQRGIAGYSLSALFVLYALFQPKPFFVNHLAGSPSIWWDDRAILKQAKRLRKTQSALRAHLFLSVGEKDSASMTRDLALLESQLADHPFEELTVTSQRFPGKNHFNATGLTFEQGLATLLTPSLRK
jgi:predicted alpha/beta superfamily hydrolase